MTELAEKPKREVAIRDAKTITRGLTAVVAANGNTRKASEALASDGIKISQETLSYWKRKNHKEEYERIRADFLPRIREEAADQHMDLAQRNMEAEGMLVERLKGNIDAIDPRDLAGAIRNVAVGSAVHTEKAQLLNDQPTERRAIDLPGTLQELKSLGVEPKHVLNLTPTVEEDVETAEQSDSDGSSSGGSEDKGSEDSQTAQRHPSKRTQE